MRQFLHKSVHVKTVYEPENFEQEKLGSVFRGKKSVRAAFVKKTATLYRRFKKMISVYSQIAD